MCLLLVRSGTKYNINIIISRIDTVRTSICELTVIILRIDTVRTSICELNYIAYRYS